MLAEVMAIGDELTSGQRLDTNSQWISGQLEQIGVPVRFHTTVGDDLQAMTDAFRIAAGRASLVVVTGGLGPTADDLTRQALADAAGVNLVKDESVLRHIESLFAQRQRSMPESNIVQAMFPEGANVIPNPHGSAPGIDLVISGGRDSGCRFFALPGVPAEMKEMWVQSVHPAIRTNAGIDRVICHRRVKCFGVGESQLESMLPDMIRRGREPRVGITVHRATITLRVTAEGPNERECFQLMEPTIKTIHECLGELVFGQEDDELEHAVMRQLQQQRRSLAVCEWGTRGILSRWLSDVEMPDTPLKGAIVVQDAAALKVFGVADTQAIHGNAAATAQLMAEKIRDTYNVDYGLSVSDIPGESDSQRIFVGLAGPDESKVHSKSYTGHPDILLERAAKQALNLVRLNI